MDILPYHYSWEIPAPHSNPPKYLPTFPYKKAWLVARFEPMTLYFWEVKSFQVNNSKHSTKTYQSNIHFKIFETYQMYHFLC